MKKLDKAAEAASNFRFTQKTAMDKRQDQIEIKPKINLALKLQVTKQDLVNRPHYQEVAEVLEEML